MLGARGRGIAVVHDDQDAVVAVEHGVGDARGQAVVPEPAVAHYRHGAFGEQRIDRGIARHAQAVAEHGVADVERRQGREQVAADVGRDVELAGLAFGELHRREHRALRTAHAKAWWAGRHRASEQLRRFCFGCEQSGAARLDVGEISTLGRGLGDELRHTAQYHFAGVFAGHRQHVLAVDPRAVDVGATQCGQHRVFDEIGLAFFHHQHRTLACAERGDLLGDQRIGDVQAIDRDFRYAEGVGQPQLLQRAHGHVVHAALGNDADVVVRAGEHLVQLLLAHELLRGRPAHIDLELLLQIGGRRQHDLVVVERRIFECVVARDARFAVALRGERAVHVAGADAQLEHDRRVRDLRELEAFLDHAHDRGQIRPRIEQPDLRLHREGVGALLHDRGAFAVVFADDDQCAAGDAGGRQIGERVGGDVGADRRFPRHRAADRIVDRCAQHRRGSRLRGVRFQVNAQLVEQILGVGQHVNQMRDRRALIAADVRHARLQQRFGDGEDALAMKLLALTQAQRLHFFLERTFHLRSSEQLRGGRLGGQSESVPVRQAARRSVPLRVQPSD